MRVSLSPDEAAVAAAVGTKRHRMAREKRRRRFTSGRGQPPGDDDSPEAMKNDIQAAGAEMAVAKAFNRFWHPDLHPQPKCEPDVGHSTQVRWTALEHGKLIVARDDPEDMSYVLVRGFIPIYDVVGYIKGSKAKQEQWLFGPNSRPSSHFVPDWALTPCREGNE